MDTQIKLKSIVDTLSRWQSDESLSSVRDNAITELMSLVETVTEHEKNTHTPFKTGDRVLVKGTDLSGHVGEIELLYRGTAIVVFKSKSLGSYMTLIKTSDLKQVSLEQR